MRQKYLMTKPLLFFFFFLVFHQQGNSQIIKGKENKLEAAQHIVELQNGTLLVRLVSKHKNIQALEKLLAQEDLRKRYRKRLEKKRNKIIAYQRKANSEIVNAFSELYAFSNYRLLYDTAMVHLFAGETSGYFLNNNLEIDNSISINLNAPYYILSLGQTSTSETHNLEGFIVSDNENKELPKPFPYFIKSIYPPLSFVDAFFGRLDSVLPNFTRMTEKLNNKLTNYYEVTIYRQKSKEMKDEFKKFKEEMKDKNVDEEEGEG